MSGQCAQLSLEYLLLLVAVLAVFAFLLPLLNNVYSLALFGLDSASAKQFAQSIEAAAQEMRFLANGSTKELTARPFTIWSVYAEGKNFFVTVKSGQFATEKKFIVEFPNEVHLQPGSFREEKAFFIKKENNAVSLEYN